MARLITIGDIAAKLGGVSRQRADQISKRPSFPPPVQTARSWRLWDEDDVDQWLDTHRPGWRGESESDT